MTTKALNLLDIGLLLKTQTGTTGEQVQLLESATGRNRGIIYGLYLLDRVSSFNSDDRIHRAALSSDSLSQIPNFLDFTQALALLPQLHSKVALDIPLLDPWPVMDPCAPIWDVSVELLPIEALSTLENIYFSWWVDSAIKRLHAELSTTCPDVIPEILTVYLVCTDHETGADLFGGLAPFTFSSHAPVESLCAAALQITDPYYCSRALWRICRYFPSHDDTLLQQAYETAALIPDIHRRVVITEKILSLLPENQIEYQFYELCTLAETIPDFDNRARALARLSMSPHSHNEQLISRALEASLQVENPSQRSCLLNEIRLTIIRKKENKREIAAWHTAVDSLETRRDIAFARGQYGSVLHSCTGYISQNHDSWIALSLFGLFEDAKLAARNETEWEKNLWSSLLDEKYHMRAYNTLCDQAVAPDCNGLTIDPSGILALDTLMLQAIELSKNPTTETEACELYNRIYRLFYFTGDASSDVLKYVMMWFYRYSNHPATKNEEIANWEQKILHQISLLAVEHGILNVDILHPILYLLQYGDDRSRIRVELALDGHYCCTANSFRRWRTSKLGLALLLELAEANWKASDHHIKIQAETIGWMAHDMIHDDAEIVHSLIGLLEVAEDSHERYVASLWLRKSECFTEEVWNTWLHYLTRGGTTLRIQTMLLSTVCKTAATTTNCAANWPMKAFDQLQELDLDPRLLDKLTVLTDWPGSVADAALEALRSHCGGTEERICTANEIIERELAKNSVRNAIFSRKKLADFGHAYYFLLRSSYPGERSVPSAVEKLMNTPEILSLVILPWLQESLEQSTNFLSVENTSEFRKQVALLEVAAGLAERLPVTYQNCATPRFAALISKCTRENESSFGRVAAVELLTKYGHVSEDTIETMKCALLDNMFVAERALACAKEFRYLDDKLLEFLIQELYHPFASISLAAAKILSGVYSGVATTSQQREKILNALTTVVQHPVVKDKFIFAIINPGKKSSQAHAAVTKIYCLGTLEQSLFLALSSVCGFTA